MQGEEVVQAHLLKRSSRTTICMQRVQMEEGRQSVRLPCLTSSHFWISRKQQGQWVSQRMVSWAITRLKVMQGLTLSRSQGSTLSTSKHSVSLQSARHKTQIVAIICDRAEKDRFHLQVPVEVLSYPKLESKKWTSSQPSRWPRWTSLLMNRPWFQTTQCLTMRMAGIWIIWITGVVSIRTLTRNRPMWSAVRDQQVTLLSTTTITEWPNRSQRTALSHQERITLWWSIVRGASHLWWHVPLKRQVRRISTQWLTKVSQAVRKPLETIAIIIITEALVVQQVPHLIQQQILAQMAEKMIFCQPRMLLWKIMWIRHSRSRCEGWTHQKAQKVVVLSSAQLQSNHLVPCQQAIKSTKGANKRNQVPMVAVQGNKSWLHSTIDNRESKSTQAEI